MDNIKPINTSEFSEILAKYSPYLKELRNRMLTTLLVFAIATIGGFFFYEQILGVLIKAFSLDGINIVFTSPFQFINLAISCGVATGILVAFPLFIYEIVMFLRPALMRGEFRAILQSLPLSLVLFLVGFIFGLIIMKWQIEIFLNRSSSLGIGNILDVSSLLTTVFLTSALMGLGFQFPIILLILMRLKLLDRKMLSKIRPWVYLASFVFVLFLPPDSLIADFVLALPFIGLFELALFLNRVQDRRIRSRDKYIEQSAKQSHK